VGLVDTGTGLADGNGQADTNYTVSGNPLVTYYNSAYAAEGDGSRWLSTSASGGSAGGPILIQTTFNVTGGDYLITGNWGIDNTGSITLDDNTVVASLLTYGVDTFNQLHAFSFIVG